MGLIPLCALWATPWARPPWLSMAATSSTSLSGAKQLGSRPCRRRPLQYSAVGRLAELGTYAETSMQPIFSSINAAHRDHAYEPPAVDNYFLTRARQGLRRAQAELQTRDSRVPLPAEAVIAVVDAALEAQLPLRAAVAISLAALFAGRQDSCVALRSRDVGMTDEHIWLRLTEIGKRGQCIRRVVRLPLDVAPVKGVASALPRIAALLRIYMDRRGEPEPDFFLQLRGEVRPTTRSMESWLAGALSVTGFSAPKKFAYQGHSLRSMGASLHGGHWCAAPRLCVAWGLEP